MGEESPTNINDSQDEQHDDPSREDEPGRDCPFSRERIVCKEDGWGEVNTVNGDFIFEVNEGI